MQQKYTIQHYLALIYYAINNPKFEYTVYRYVLYED